VAADLLAEAESLTETGALATPADVARQNLPPPVVLSLPGTDAAAVPPPAPDDPPSARGPNAAALDAADPETALAALDQALEATPDDAGLLLRRAERHLTARRFAAAQRDLERVLHTQSDHADALVALGVVLSRKGLWGAAVPHLRRAVDVDPSRAGAWHILGEALNHVDDLDGALDAFEHAVALEPAHARALHGLGVVLDRLNRPADATLMYRRAREATGR
jgi:Tfp pilus assembly protein PilF